MGQIFKPLPSYKRPHLDSWIVGILLKESAYVLVLILREPDMMMLMRRIGDHLALSLPPGVEF
jgi:hypothetical protein